MSKLKLAVLDLYNGIPNQGMRCIRSIIEDFAEFIDYDVFDVRANGITPSLDYDIYISSGGPGDPRAGEGQQGWEDNWNDWLTRVLDHNKVEQRKKYVFLICHSFQMAVYHFGLAEVMPRKTLSFGTFPIHPEHGGVDDVLFAELSDPFWAADFRRFQAIQPNCERFKEMGAEVLALEKIRHHVDLERAIMAVRLSPQVVGVQFHPEADPEGMMVHFSRPDIKQEVVSEHGHDKWLQIMEDLSHPERIAQTHDHMIPGFLRRAVAALQPVPAVQF